MTTLTEKIKRIIVVGALAGALGGCIEEDGLPLTSRTTLNCKQTVDRWGRISICQLDDRERWSRPYSGSMIDYFKDGRIVVYKENQKWEYLPSGILMTDGMGNRYKMEMVK